ncbi:MAG: precorrin-6y C5,15-methyltransferase (decarboxylating) subunit CbiE [Nitrospirae bacterium]|nr:precorrin-6y C5,15-methyltransferase (decarboxylating) subunit CbiE [Nitrospirota bacterium]MBF0542285.1 precorrin-6y C5,15-methyltransferase (decarboxylating) subunit CbiE [Nitrospirota bacterium]
MHQIYIISVGPGSRDYVTQTALKTALICDVIIGMDYQVNAIDVRADSTVFVQSDINSILDLIDSNAGKKIGVLVTGDAGIFSLSRKIMERFGCESVVEIIPGVSSIQTAFARIMESWVNVKIYSFHGRALSGIDEILTLERAAILCGSDHNSKMVLTELTEAGLFQKQRIIYVCQNLTFSDERIIRINNERDILNLQPSRREIIIL